MRNSDFYNEQFNEVYNSGFVGFLKSIVHRIMEFPFRKESFSRILELGAGEGFHRQFVISKYDQYLETDISERKGKELPSQKSSFQQQNAESLSFEDNSFDRTIATCLIAHLDHPFEALQEWRRVTKDSGFISIYIPCEPGFLLRGFRAVFLVSKARAGGSKDFNFRIASEHRNSYIMCKAILKEEFKGDDVRMTRFPFPFLSWNFNIFAVAKIRVSK
jgi:SAM-dependent methyltransferase